MRFILRFLAWVFGALAVFLVIAAAVVYTVSSHRLHRHFVVAAAAVPLAGTSEAIERGHHLAIIRGCSTCHGADFGGAKVMDNSAMGRVYGPNLTRGQGGLGAQLQDEDWVRAVREGVASDGHPVFIMPAKDYADLTDEDLGAVLGYIRTLPPVDRQAPSISVGPVARILLTLGKIQLSADVIDHGRKQPVARIKAEVSPEYGRYVATICSGCHNSHFSGGKIADGAPDWPPAANLTRGPGSAITGWSEADFIRTLRTGKAPNGQDVNPIMPRAFGAMNDVELKALWSYLQTLPSAATGLAAGT